MDFLASNSMVAKLEADLRAASGPARLALMLEVAWYQRQRHTRRALTLADEVQNLLPQSRLPPQEVQRMALRLKLIWAEGAWLFADLAAGRELANAALQGFTALNDPIGGADARFLLVAQAFDMGDDGSSIDPWLQQITLLTLEHDPLRCKIAQAYCALGAAHLRTITDSTRMQQQQQAQDQTLHPALLSWSEEFLAADAEMDSDFAKALQHLVKAHALALETGQIRRTIVICAAIAHALTHLDEHHAALEWMQRALGLARQCGWPICIGITLLQTAETMYGLQHIEAAYELLQEALAVLEPLASSRYHASAKRLAGEIELGNKEYESALATFKLVEQRAIAFGQPDLQSVAQRGQALALSRLGRARAALAVASNALDNAHSNTVKQIAALEVMAEIHANHDLPPPPGMQAENASLHYLQQARTLAGTIARYTVPPALLDTMAQQYALAGNFAKAWETGQAANLARQKTRHHEARQRASAMQLHRQTEQARHEAEHLRQLARAHSERAEVLQQTSETLSHLSAVGQEITAQLDANRVFDILNQHIHHLLKVNILALYQLDASGTTLHRSFTVVNGQLPAPGSVAMSSPCDQAALCARERREIVIDNDTQASNPDFWIKDLPQPASALFAPLSVGTELLGVMTTQSYQSHAYGEREQLVFRTLCAYTAIALANARAHDQLSQAHLSLQKTQQQLLLQEKMAGLGTLTAGVAHEINNPTHFVHVAAQNQQVKLAEFEQFIDSIVKEGADPEIVQVFADHFATLAANLKIMLNGTERIKGIVKDLRSFTRLDEAEKKAVRLSGCLNSTLNLVRTSWLEKVEFVTEFINDPEIECWPALLNQVFMNLLVNGCQAIEETGGPGKLVLRLFQQGSELLVEIEDSGIGVPPEIQARIMEPFYTTKEVGKGTGLGLSIAFNIVEKHGGSLRVRSTPGHGSCFTIALPWQPVTC
jgi:signal transduction histidine kinase